MTFLLVFLVLYLAAHLVVAAVAGRFTPDGCRPDPVELGQACPRVLP